MWYCERCNRTTIDLPKEHQKKCNEFKKEKDQKLEQCVCGATKRSVLINAGALFGEEKYNIGAEFSCGTKIEQDKYWGWKEDRTISCCLREIQNLKRKIKEIGG